MEQLYIKIMCRFERNINRIYTLGGIILLIIVIMAMSSCSRYGVIRMKMAGYDTYYPCGGEGVK